MQGQISSVLTKEQSYIPKNWRTNTLSDLITWRPPGDLLIYCLKLKNLRK